MRIQRASINTGVTLEYSLADSPSVAALIGRSATKDRVVGTRLREMYATVSKDALELTALNIDSYDYTDTIRRHRIPMLLVKGELDRDINSQLGSTLAALSEKPNFELVGLPGAGHFANMEQPTSFNQALGRFLEGIENAGQSASRHDDRPGVSD